MRTPQILGPFLILPVEIEDPAVGDAFAVAGLDVQGGAAVVEEGEAVQVLVFVGLDVDVDFVAVLGGLGDGVVGNRGVEVEGVAAAVGDAPGDADVREVGVQDAVLDLDGIARHHLGGAADGIHPVDVDGEVAALDTLADHLRLTGFPGGLFFPRLRTQDAAGGHRQRRGEEGYNPLFHIASVISVCAVRPSRPSAA